MKKRLVSWLLAAAVSIMQLLPSAAVIAYADDGSVASVTASSVSGKPGELVDVDLSIADNPGLNALGITVEYDDAALECVDIIDKECFGSTESYYEPPENLKEKCFRIGWKNDSEMYTENNIFCTIQFKIRETAFNGEYEISISQKSEGEAFRYESKDGEQTAVNVPLNYSNGVVKVTDSTNKPEYTGDAPEAPVISNITLNSFDVEVPQGNEYTYSASEITDFSDCTWYTDRTISNLTPNTKYYVYQRVAETDTVKASSVSAAAEAVTEKYDISDVIESVSVGMDGTVGTVLKPVIKFKNGFNSDHLGKITYLWSTAEGTDTSVSMAETYTVTDDDANDSRKLNLKLSAENCKGIITSNTVTAGKRNYDVAKDGAIIPASVIKTADGFIIAAMKGYEYTAVDISAEPKPAVWADLGSDITVTGKAPGSIWYIFTRVKETDTVNASEPSAPISVKIPSDNSKLAYLLVDNGELNPSFDPDITEYTVIVPYGVKVPDTVAEKQSSEANLSIKQATDFDSDNKTVITVTAENGISQTVYTVTFVERSVLSSLSVNDAVIDGFSPTRLEYTYSVSYENWFADKNKVYNISASANGSAGVAISENAFALNSDDHDAAAEKEVTITVTSKKGEKTVYTVKFIVEACPHTSRTESISKDPTCTELGEKEIVCAVCGKSFGIENISAVGHDFDNGTNTSDPDCVNIGTVTYSCSRCSESFTRIIPALGHTWGEVTVDAAASCTADGVSSRYCTVCGAQSYFMLIPASGHSFGEWTKVSDTAYERACQSCGTKETADVTDTSHDHIFNGTVEMIAPADCSTAGSQKVYCSVTDCTEFVTEETAKEAHTPAEDVVVNADCVKAGSITVNCKICGTRISETEIPAAGHSFTSYTDTASCMLPGVRTAVCDNGCGVSDSIPTPAKGHSYGDWLKDSTGHWHECTVCGNLTAVIVHTERGVITTPATETTDGTRTYSCTECGYVIRTETVPATGSNHKVHTFSAHWTNDSTYHWHECTVCGERADMTYHNENNAAVTVQPTETTAGIRTYSCSVCGYAVRTETIPATGSQTPSDPTPPSEPAPPSNPTPTPPPSYPPATYPTNTDPQPENEPYIYGDTSKTGWDAIISEIDFAPEGSTVKINMNKNTELPQAVVSRIRNRNISLELNIGSSVWTINGFDVTEPKTVNMRVAEKSNIIPASVMEGLYSELPAKQLRLYHSGSFGFTAKLAVNVGKKYNGYYAALYYYDSKTKQLEYSGQSYVSGGKAEFEFTHASYYAIGFSSEPIFDDVSSNAGVTDFGTLVDVDSPSANGVRVPQAAIPRGFRLSNKKRRYRILKKRRLDDLIFVL